MNKNTKNSLYEKELYEQRKALHENNLSREGIKFFPKDFEKIQEYIKNAPLNTSVRCKIVAE